MRLGRYDVDELLARGGMGEVYRGRLVAEHGFVRPIVIKLLRTELLADERAALMFIDEARIAAGLHHRNILQIVDFDRFEGGAFIVTEWIEGCDLRALLQNMRAAPRYDLAVTSGPRMSGRSAPERGVAPRRAAPGPCARPRSRSSHPSGACP